MQAAWIATLNFCMMQDLLNDPNPNSPAQSDAYMLFTQKPAEYKRRVRAQTSAHPPPA